jgi:osmotically inducible protein OsmC
MPDRKADAKWTGSLREGSGELALGSGAWKGPYDFRSRFEQGGAANPEELVGAAHAGCFTMAMTAIFGREQITPAEIRTTATVHLKQEGGNVWISKIDLVTRGRVPGIDQAKFAEVAELAKKNCAISKALAGVAEITLDAKLES